MVKTHSTKRTIISILLLIIFTIMTLNTRVYAASPENQGIPYSSNNQVVTPNTIVWETGTYCATGDVTIDGPVKVIENTTLKLEDGAELTVNGGIILSQDRKLTVCAGPEGTGVLQAVSDEWNYAGIGTAPGAPISTNTGLKIEGGTVIARGGDMAPGIGCQEGIFNVTVNDGDVFAYAGRDAAGIDCGNALLQLSGGFVYAKGSEDMPGIQTSVLLQDNKSILMAESGDNQSAAITANNYQSKKGLVFENGQGKLPDSTYTICHDLTIPENYTLKLESRDELTIDYGVSIINYGTIQIDDGTTGVKIINNGNLVDYGQNAFDAIFMVGNPVLLSELSLNQKLMHLDEEDSGRLYATVVPSALKDQLKWTSSNPQVAEVTAEGVVKANGEGKAVITVSVNGLSASCTVEVSKRVIPVESVSLDRTELSMEADETVTLTSTVSPADATDRTVDWTVADPEIVSVQDGQVTALKEGSTVVTASAGGKSASCTVTVSAPSSDIPVESVVLSETSLTVEVGETVQLTAEVYPEDATNRVLTWSVERRGVAAVQDGWVTGLRAGATTKVYAIAGDQFAECVIEVVEPAKPVLPEEKPDEEEEDTGCQPEKEDGNQAEEIPSDSSDLPSVPELPEGDGNFDGGMDFFRPASVPDGWKDSGGGTVYYRDGVRATGWQEVGGETYFFDEKGLLQTGWIEQPEGWYYAGETGAQRLGWQKVGNAWYYLDAETGRMLDGGLAEIDGETYYFYDWGGMANSWWMETEEGWYFFDGSGAMKKSGWVLWKEKYYYLTDSGKMAVDTRTPDGYVVDAEGVWIE